MNLIPNANQLMSSDVVGVASVVICHTSE